MGVILGMRHCVGIQHKQARPNVRPMRVTHQCRLVTEQHLRRLGSLGSSHLTKAQLPEQSPVHHQMGVQIRRLQEVPHQSLVSTCRVGCSIARALMRVSRS